MGAPGSGGQALACSCPGLPCRQRPLRADDVKGLVAAQPKGFSGDHETRRRDRLSRWSDQGPLLEMQTAPQACEPSGGLRYSLLREDLRPVQRTSVLFIAALEDQTHTFKKKN